MNIRECWKGVLGFVAPGAVLIGSAVLESSAGGDRITQAEWITAVVACVVTGSAVFSVPNQVAMDGPAEDAPRYGRDDDGDGTPDVAGA